MKRAPTNLAASVPQRLLNLARAWNRPFNELLQNFAIERFLYRFSLRRATPLPQESPSALTDAFSEDPAKQSLWQSFLRKGRLNAEGKSLPEVVGELRAFLMPLVGALTAGREFRKEWKDGR